jgi:hypothetical protein
LSRKYSICIKKFYFKDFYDISFYIKYFPFLSFLNVLCKIYIAKVVGLIAHPSGPSVLKIKN